MTAKSIFVTEITILKKAFICLFFQVTDDVVECETVKEEKCENVVSGYTSEQKCSVWPKEVIKLLNVFCPSE